MNTHRTVHDVPVEIRSGHTVDRFTVPAGTEGVVEYQGVIGGEPVVLFKGGGIEANLIGPYALRIERIDQMIDLLNRTLEWDNK